MCSCTALRSEFQHRWSIRSKHPHWLEGWFGSKQCNPIHLIKIKELYEVLENATDKAEDAANVLEAVVLKSA